MVTNDTNIVTNKCNLYVELKHQQIFFWSDICTGTLNSKILRFAIDLLYVQSNAKHA